MVMNTNSSIHCDDDSHWEKQSDGMYMYFYLLLFLPGLVLNTTALWVLCRYISKKTKAVIFMINLALADLVHILSLPLRIYYYLTHKWPFGQAACLGCFYLKYLNMYAAIMFLVCISVQRCVFLLKPFSARGWRRRYDLLISFVVWVVVGLGCSPFIFMRSSSSSLDANVSAVSNVTQFMFTNGPHADPSNQTRGCFKDLPMRPVPLSVLVMMMTLGELFGFLIPLLCNFYSSFRIARSLTKKQESEACQSSTRSRLFSFSSSDESRYGETHAKCEKRRALRMVLSCSCLFLLCFGPYHVSFLLYLLASQNILTDCGIRLAVKQFHSISLCISNLSCCLNPVLYYFLTAEFRMHFTMRSPSLSGTLLSSPLNSPTNIPSNNNRPKRMESTLSTSD